MELEQIEHSAGWMPEEYAAGFVGSARLQMFQSPFVMYGGPTVYAMHFDPGARTRPHIHHSGHVLVVTEGEGIVANFTGFQLVKPGDVITVAPGEWHWHGAISTDRMSHITIQMPGTEDVSYEVDEQDWATNYI